MPAWWDSLETVNSLTWWLKWVGGALTFIGAICVIVTLPRLSPYQSRVGTSSRGFLESIRLSMEKARLQHEAPSLNPRKEHYIIVGFIFEGED